MIRLALAISMLLVGTSLAHSASPDPLRLIPDKANLVIKIENPRALVEGFRSLDAYKNVTRLDPVREALDSAAARRFFEFIAYYERDLGSTWPGLTDKLAGGGIAVGSKLTDGIDDPVLFVVQATDEALLAKFVERATGVIEEELARGNGGEKTSREKYQDIETLSFGKDLHACRLGSVLLFSNKSEGLKKGIDQHLENSAKGGKPARNMANSPMIFAARKLLPADPQVWFWYGFDYLKARDDAKELLVTPRNNTILTFLFAGFLDVVRRADYVAGGLYRSRDGYDLTIRMPAGRDGMAADGALHLPTDAKVPGTLPLLEPKGTLFSHSFYLDLGILWTRRDEIMSAQNARDFEKGVKDVSRFVPGAALDKLLTQSGKHHRFVVAGLADTDYKIEPKVKLPGFAFVTSMRDPAFGKSVETLIRGGAFLASTQVSLKLFEDKYDSVALFGYRFPEDGKFPDDPQNLRFNFSPTFATVGDQFVAASSMSLCRELIDLVKKEDRARPTSINMRMRGYADGTSKFLNASPDALLTQTILSQAIPEGEAKKQVQQFLDYVRTLGTLGIETDYLPGEFRFDLKWRTK